MDDTTIDGMGDGLGTMTTGAIAAREIERAHAPGHDHSDACANCGATLAGPYCQQCGQHGHVHRTAMALVHDIAHGVFHFEGRIWRTLPLLAFRPGELTRRYVRGQRASFVSPMALFLFTVFLTFAVASSLGTVNFEGLGGANPQAAVAEEREDVQARIARLEQRRAADAGKPETTPADIAEWDTGLAEARRELAGLNDAAAVLAGDTSRGLQVNLGSASLEKRIRALAADPKLALYKFKTAGYKYSWALIPISLPFIWLLFFWRRDVGMYDHAIFATYSLSFMMMLFIVLAVLAAVGAPDTPLLIAAGVVPPVHLYKQMKGAYGLGRFGATWRTLMLLAMMTVTVTLFVMLLIYMGATG